MSELINNSRFRKDKLKELILKLHEGNDPQQVRNELVSTLKQIPYGEVVEVEQELIAGGLPESEVLRLCDIHGEVLDGHIDQSGSKSIPPGHPVDVFINENRELVKVTQKALGLLGILYEITGPPKVMWGKHDEIRDQLKACIEILRTPGLRKQDLADAEELLFSPVLKALADMTKKEQDILFPMCMDVLTEEDWWQIHSQTLEFGFTLYDPQVDWKPEGFTGDRSGKSTFTGTDGNIQLPSGSFSASEIMAILNTLPVDMTFVDRNDKVKYFSQGSHRIFPRSRSIINRDVRLCHPPGSVHIVEKILEDFKSGKASHAPFWIQMRGKFIYIEYYALRDENGEYMGTLEVSQDLTQARSLSGEQRIISYSANNETNG